MRVLLDENLRYAPKLSSISELPEDLLQRSHKLARIMY
jgi:hypothetical protein